jgi:CBS domain-containing protein
MEGPTISDMSITDEHFVVDGKAAVSTVASNLAKSPNDAILIKDKKGAVVGVVTIKDIFGAMASGVNIMKVKFEKIMRTNLLTAPSNLPLTKAIDMIAKQGPDAIIIMDGPQFVGYFSPDDYRDATRRIEAHQTMVKRLSKSKTALGAAASSAPVEEEDETAGLLGVLLGGIEDEDEEEFGGISL